MIDEDRPFAEDPPRAGRRGGGVGRAGGVQQPGRRASQPAGRRWRRRWRRPAARTHDRDDHPRAAGRHVLGQDPGGRRAGGQGARDHAASTRTTRTARSRPRWCRTPSTARSTASPSPWPTPDAVVPVAQKADRRPASRSWRSTRASATTSSTARRCTSARTRRLAGQDHRHRGCRRPARRQGAVRDPGAGPVALEARCAGVKKGFAEHREPAGQRRRPAVGAADASRRSWPQDPSITEIVTLGAPIALAALQAEGGAPAAPRRSSPST